MIVSEFVKKYKAPSNLVYEASFMTRTRMETSYKTDIPEEELVEAVACLAEKRIKFHREKLSELADLINRLK